MSVGVDKLTKDPRKKSRNFRRCSICHGPHYAQECPLMHQVSSMKIEGDVGKTHQIATPKKGNSFPKCDTLGGSTVGVMLNQGLMYVSRNINDHDVKALVDTGATHNFIQVETAKRFGLNLSPFDSLMKSVDTAASRSNGVVKDVTIRFDGRTGNVDFLAVNLDDFEVILGHEFLKKGKVMVMLTLVEF